MSRPPKPNEIHEITKPKLYGVVKARVENTPKAKKEIKPMCPRHFTKGQRKQWKKYSVALGNYNLFSIANQSTLEILCVYKDLFDKHKIDLDNADDESFQTCLSAMHKMVPVIERCLSKLGLSSTDLAKIGALTAGAMQKKSKMKGLLG